jgi:hypothetical protein
MESESFPVYGPEYKEARNSLLNIDDEIAKDYLFQKYYISDGCFVGKADQPIRALLEFLTLFPSSKYRTDIQTLLSEYRAGRMTCDGSSGSE